MIVPIVTTNRRFGSDSDGVIVESKEDGSYYIVTIRQIREPVTIYINAKPEGAEAETGGTTAWGESGLLYVRSSEPGDAVVYNALGARVTTVAPKAGETVAVPLPAGVYIVSFRGATCKAIVK
jgi:hypothetical protein